MRPKCQRPLYDPEADQAGWQARRLAIRLGWSLRVRIARTSPRIDQRLAEAERDRDLAEAARLGIGPRIGHKSSTSACKYGIGAGDAERQRRAIRAATIYRRMLKRSRKT